MSILKKIFSSAAGDLVNSVGGVIDNLVTTDDERLAARAKIKQIVLDHEAKMEQNITDRWTADMNSDSWLSKNVRPMVLIFLIICTMLLIFIDAGAVSFKFIKSHCALLRQHYLLSFLHEILYLY